MPKRRDRSLRLGIISPGTTIYGFRVRLEDPTERLRKNNDSTPLSKVENKDEELQTGRKRALSGTVANGTGLGIRVILMVLFMIDLILMALSSKSGAYDEYSKSRRTGSAHQA
jgi:hypothetical protein